jgi:antitoxin (DNA-binding transcriptional repressor) of toxin-antitoxin stability system
LTRKRARVQLKMNLEAKTMSITINAKQLRASLPKLVERVRKGGRFTVLYRSRPAFQIVPVGETDVPPGPLESDPVYRAPAVGRSTDGRTATEHDAVLYRS